MPLPPLTKPVPKPEIIKSICVFCGANESVDSSYFEQANALGNLMVKKGYSLIYGGQVGLMGAVAKAVVEGGGKAKGIVPVPLYRNGSNQFTETVIVPDMHTRKQMMSEESDAFIALPGGFGTMEELLEVITWSQLNIHSKPIILLNTNNYYDLFTQWINHCAGEKFISGNNKDIFVVCNSVDEVEDALNNYEPPASRYGLDWTDKSTDRSNLI
ncbi:hypothetical protein K450DRAFT_222739 [Umbelopsis ramanniana AG]|uniref:Cytokinin riboside 5'-monophosphate phosphoribohydrolase n=1 Tax=Umbelopsis ramanniana AG TaxID=1314678 RepID=A0AAD5EG59_UMBRA|nr:uncharacterized protein K450DRAFT_222739 [Umbelopsis ramanniana AG]KAI8583258.1 hypothetical protein K450DRAFT_222739 [Umbelopsis ramanniana AG]